MGISGLNISGFGHHTRRRLLRYSKLPVLGITLANALGVALSARAPSTSTSRIDRFAIRDVRIFDGSRVLAHRTVMIRDGQIESVGLRSTKLPPDYSVIEGRGRTLLPGLIDAHVHISPVFASDALRQEVAFGVTTVLDMYTGAEGIEAFRAARERNADDEADFRIAGSGATVPGGHPTELTSKGQRPLPTISDPALAQEFVDDRIREGSQYLKIIYDDGHSFGTPEIHYNIMSFDLLSALVAAAHKRGLIAVVHIESVEQAEDALRAGADGLAHTPIGPQLPSDFGAFVKSHHAFVITTLTTDHWFCGDSRGKELMADPRLGPYVLERFRAGLTLPLYLKQKASCIAADKSIRQYERARVPVLLGTDSPVPGTSYGISMHDELRRVVANGLSPVQALRSATSEISKTFKLDDRGRIVPGARADLILVKGDPTHDIDDISNIVSVWIAGHLINRIPQGQVLSQSIKNER